MLSIKTVVTRSVLFMLAPVMLLSGCVATIATVSETTEVRPDQGLVVLRMLSNTSAPQLASARWQSMELVRINTGNAGSSEQQEIFTVSRTQAGSLRSAIMLGALPAGVYKINKLNGDRFYVEINDELPQFSVKPGKTTWLGTLVDHPEFNLAFSGGLFFAVDTRQEDMLKVLAREYPKMGNVLVGEPLGWNGEFKPRGPFVPIGMIASNTAVLNKPVRGVDGRIYAGSLLGRILVRGTDSKWSAYDTGSIHEIITVYPAGRNTLLAGGDAGLLLMSDNDGKSWKRLPELPVRGAIFYISRDSSGVYYALVRRASEVFLFTSSDITKGGWQAVRQFATQQGWNVPWSATEANLVDDRLFLALPPSNFHLLNTSTKQWSDSLAPFSWTSNIRTLPGGMVYTVGTTAILNSLFISQDYGKTWKEFDTSTRSSNPVFMDATGGYMTHSKAISIIAAQYEQVLHRTQDGGATWQEAGTLPTKMYNGMFGVGPGSPLFLTTSDGNVYASLDQGRNWKLEREVATIFGGNRQ